MRECQSISKTTSLVRWYTQGQPVKRCQGYGCPRLTNVHGEWRLAYLVRSHRRAKAQTADIRNSGLDRKLSEHTVHWNLLRIRLHSCRLVRVPTMTPVYCLKYLQWAHECQNCIMKQWKKVDEWIMFRSGEWLSLCVCVYVCFTWEKHGSRMHYGNKTGQWRQCYDLGFVLLGNHRPWHSCGCFFDTYHLPPKKCCTPHTPLHGNSVPWWQWPLLDE